MDCSGTEKGIASLKENYQKLINKHPSLKEANSWLDSEDEILEKLPALDRGQIQVCHLHLFAEGHAIS